MTWPVGRSIQASRFRPWRVGIRCTVEVGRPRIGPIRAGPVCASFSARIPGFEGGGGAVRGCAGPAGAVPQSRFALGLPPTVVGVGGVVVTPDMQGQGWLGSSSQRHLTTHDEF
ncbi:hypothetical protein GCM10010507_38130 [Streptomyces cinnamoneus]|uniref:Uncharacterized protein n=1 Tax=Streptomyces cinnamoneus TaxID=53446 RepID=A0A918TSG9_STRCJ|nr:hypothetical protein GCM10010507_38130 [Streptomyces cinnamoneus]